MGALTKIERRVRILVDDDPPNPRQEWDNATRMVCWHRRYNLGDEQPSETPHEWRQSMAIEMCPRLEHIIDYWDNDGFDQLLKKYKDYATTRSVIDEHINELIDAVWMKHCVALPLYLYDHGDVTMNTTGFTCPWDSGQVGYIYCTLETMRKEFNLSTTITWATTVPWGGKQTSLREIAELWCASDVKVYDSYLRGDVYGFIVEECLSCSECGNENWEVIDSCWGFFGQDPRTNGMADHLGDEKLLEMACTAEIEYRRS